MKLAIIGIRYTDPVNKIVFNDYQLVEDTIMAWFQKPKPDHPDYPWELEEWKKNRFKFDEIVSGGAIGADKMGEQFADEWEIKKTIFLPDWEKHGKKAGFVRNRDIIENSDFVLAFWDGLSKGSANSLSIAKKLKKPTLIIYV